MSIPLGYIVVRVESSGRVHTTATPVGKTPEDGVAILRTWQLEYPASAAMGRVVTLYDLEDQHV